MMTECRRTDRFPFEAPVEVIREQSHERITGVTGEISLHGCFVNTVFSFPVGSVVNLTISEPGRSLSVTGEIAYVLTRKGIGIRFCQIESEDAVALQEWLEELNTVPILLRS